jgi:hypothetical protein
MNMATLVVANVYPQIRETSATREIRAIRYIRDKEIRL